MVIAMGTPDRSVWHMPAMPLESRVFDTPLTKDDIENWQLSAFLQSAQNRRALGLVTYHEQVVKDPPDFLLGINGESPFSVELTTFSTSDVSRQRADEIRTLGRTLEQKIRDNAPEFPHLRGRVIGLSEMRSDRTRPKKRNKRQLTQLIDELLAALKIDRGVVNRNWSGSMGYPPDSPPQTVPAEIAQQGRVFIHDYHIEVNPTGNPNAAPKVNAAVQLDVRIDELRDRLVTAVNRKDRATNEILLISTGVPDKQGYVMSGDYWIFKFIFDLRNDGLAINPVHLKQVIVHHWGSNEAFVLYQRMGSRRLLDNRKWPEPTNLSPSSS